MITQPHHKPALNLSNVNQWVQAAKEDVTFNPPMPLTCVQYTPLQTIPQMPHSILPCLQTVFNTHLFKQYPNATFNPPMPSNCVKYLFKQYPKCHSQSSHAFNLCSIHTSSNNTPANDFFSLQPFCFIWWTTCTSPTKVIPLKRPRFSSHGRLRTLSLSTFYCLQPGCSG